MKVCYFGIYDPEYARSKVLTTGLRENGVEVVECRVDPKEKYKYWKLFRKHKNVGGYDVMLVGFPGHPVMPLAKLVCRRPLVFDAFLSRYDSVIFDRKIHSPFSFQAFKCWFFDWLGCKLADAVLLDTKEHIKYFVEKFGIKREKFYHIYIGSEEEVMRPRPGKQKRDYFLVNFHGTFIPVQGLQYVIQAAKLLEPEGVRFNIIGRGQTYKEIRGLADKLQVRNVNFIDPVPFEEVAEYIAEADVSLGIFGDSMKTTRAIPNKAYETIAMRKPLITADTPAARELLKNRENCLLCKTADGADLAEKVLELKSNPALAKKIAEGGYRLFKQKLTPKSLGRELKKVLEKLLRS